MTTKKTKMRKITRMIIALISCFVIFLFMFALMKDAPDWLVYIMCMVVGGTILFMTYLIGDYRDNKRAKLHEAHLKEIENRKKLNRASKRSPSSTFEVYTDDEDKK